MEGRAKKLASAATTSDLAYIEAIKPQPGDDPDDKLCVDVLIRIRTLLRAGKGVHNVDAVDDVGRTALHYACWEARSVEVVRALVDSCGASVNIRDTRPWKQTPIMLCALEDDRAEMRVFIIAFLRERGASLDLPYEDGGKTALMQMCISTQYKTAVRFLRYGADPNAKDERGNTALWYAINNLDMTIAAQMVECLFKAGADPNIEGEYGFNVSVYACKSLPGRNIALLAPHIPRSNQMAATNQTISVEDPIGNMTESTRYGSVWHKSSYIFPQTLRMNHEKINGSKAPMMWSLLRTGTKMFLNGSVDNDEFTLLGQSTDINLWRLFLREWGPYWQHPITRKTLLHLAVLRQPAMIPMLMAAHVNPLLLDSTEKSPADYTKDATMLAQLRAYATWTPHRFKTYWFGPYFEMRAVAFCCVCKYWAEEDVRFVSKDIQQRIIQWIAAMEYTYVTTRE